MEENARISRITAKAATVRIESWCAYQERSHYEVRNKLFEWNVYPSEVDQIISRLIADNFLNEERFAMAYVSGKFKIKKWGKIRIRQGLKQKKITDKLIMKALCTIDPDDYLRVLQETAEKKKRLITEKNPLKLKFKLVNYLLGRGFERDLVFDVLNQAKE